MAALRIYQENRLIKIAAHKGIKASGERIVCGFSSSDVFGKVAAEVSYMDKNCTNGAMPPQPRERSLKKKMK